MMTHPRQLLSALFLRTSSLSIVVAAAMIILLGFVAPCQLKAQVSEPEWLHTSVLNEGNSASAGRSIYTVGCGECAPNAGSQSNFGMLFRAGSSYYSLPGESRFGGGYGLEGGVGLNDDWGLVGNLDVNHLELGEQILGSLGIVKLPDHAGCEILDPLSLSLNFDQLTDTRIDTIRHSLYLGQLRFQAGYAPRESVEFGVMYTEPIIRDTDVNFRFVQFPGSLPMAGRVDMSRVYAGYYSRQLELGQMALVAGYREDPGTFLCGVNIRREVTDRLAFFASGSYENDQDNFGTALGLEFLIDRNSRQRSRSSELVSLRRDAAVRNSEGINRIHQVKYVPPEKDVQSPRDGLGDFSINELNPPNNSIDENAVPPDQSPAPNRFNFNPQDLPLESPFRDNFWQRYVQSLHRVGSQQFRSAVMAYSRRNADGFTDPVQREAQKTAGGLGFQGRDGSIIGQDGQTFD